MSNFWWLQNEWKKTLCANCGVNIWDEGGDPDHGVCYECFNINLNQKNKIEDLK